MQDIIIVGYCSTVHVLERLVLVIFMDMLNSYITVHPFLVTGNKGWTSLFLRIWTALDILLEVFKETSIIYFNC